MPKMCIEANLDTGKVLQRYFNSFNSKSFQYPSSSPVLRKGIAQSTSFNPFTLAAMPKGFAMKLLYPQTTPLQENFTAAIAQGNLCTSVPWQGKLLPAARLRIDDL